MDNHEAFLGEYGDRSHLRAGFVSSFSSMRCEIKLLWGSGKWRMLLRLDWRVEIPQHSTRYANRTLMTVQRIQTLGYCPKLLQLAALRVIFLPGDIRGAKIRLGMATPNIVLAILVWYYGVKDQIDGE